MFMSSAVQPGINRERTALGVWFCLLLVCSLERSLLSFVIACKTNDSAYAHL